MQKKHIDTYELNGTDGRLSYSIYVDPNDPEGYELWFKMDTAVFKMPLEHLVDLSDMIEHAAAVLWALKEKEEATDG